MSSSTDVHMEPKPPDGSEPPQQNKVSFRDKLLGCQVSNIQREKVDLIGSKKPNSNRVKGKAQVKDQAETSLKKVQDQPKVLIEKPASGTLSNDGVVFTCNSLVSSSEKNTRKKRHRVDSSYKPAQLTASPAVGPKTELKTSAESSSLNVKSVSDSSSHGIKTILNVDILSANRMRFRDEDDPGGVLVTGKSDINHEQDMENVSVDDIHEEGNNLPPKDVKSNPPC
ncbi:zinc ion binding nucleic acid binding protein [Sesbania bispinosa]|nr:zinc ion binding nucleic acid binding protein [Sesbania bispinosa]